MVYTYLLPAVLLALATVGDAAPYRTTQPGSIHKPRDNPNTITWGPCPADLGFLSNVTCASYEVPLDWNHPEGNETIKLGMSRTEARDKANRIGYMFINPGGPGGQASRTGAGIYRRVPAAILERFDIIGLDPRGVGLSTPVQCDVEIWNQRVAFFPQTQLEFDQMVAYNMAAGQSCRKLSGRLIDFVDTISAAKDHEAVRLALGGEKATFVGLSYGTQLFSQYAQLYPDGFRAMLLDGNLQHSQTESSNLLVESTTYETTLKQFFSWCNANSTCPLVGQDVQAAFLNVLALAKSAPIPAPDCDDGPSGCRSSVTEEEARFNMQGFLISPANWPLFGQALIDAQHGNASLISEMQPLAIGNAYEDSYLFGGAAIQCQDWSHTSKSLADVKQKEILGAAFSPLTRGASQSYKIQVSCIGWPAPLTNPEKPVTYTGNTTILMVNAIYDPSTSYTWALGLYQEIENAVLLTRNGSGHTSYLRSGGGETSAAENAYLLNLTLPAPGTVYNT